MAGPGASGAAATDTLTVYDHPTADYLGPITCKFDLSHYADFTQVTYLDNRMGKPAMCGVMVSFDTLMEKRKTPRTWSRWARPPFIELSKPCVLWSMGETSVTIFYARAGDRSEPLTTVGFEAQPNALGVHTIHADFYDTVGNLLGTISRDVDGNMGARLFAATTSVGEIGSVVVHSDVDFALAAFRMTTSHDGET